MKPDARKVNTKFLIGTDYYLAFNKEVWDKGPHQRDAWARNWLKKNKIRARSTVYLYGSDYYLGLPRRMVITSIDYKK